MSAKEKPNQNSSSSSTTSDPLQNDNQNGGDGKEKTTTKNLSTEEKIEKLIAAMNRLKNSSNLLSEEAAEDFKLINVRFSSGTTLEDDQKLNLCAIEFGIVELSLDVWKQMFELDFIDPKDKVIWNVMYRVLSTMWNGSDQFKDVCERLLKNDAHKYFLEVIQHPKIAESKKSDPIHIYTVCGMFGIIHNMLMHLGETSRNAFRKLNAVGILQKFLQSENKMIKAKAFINLAYLINEEENELINADDVHIQYIVELLKDAVNSVNRRSKKGFSALETIEALNKLAVNDNNKVRIHNCGALQFYEKLLLECATEEEKITIIHGIWILSFNKQCKDTINGMPQLQSILKKLSSSENEGLRKVACGTLWVLKAEVTKKDISSKKDVKKTETNDVQHIMISYNWDVKPMVLQIRDRLVEAGFKVWMDVDNMTGSTLEAMADAVEKAAVVIVCMTQRYKESPSCRTEAEYTYQLRKSIVPLRLEAGYKADGWLGIMVGTKLWFDFTKKFQPAIVSLIKELGNRGRLRQSSELHMVQALVEELGRSKKPASWSQEEVEAWLRQNGLSQLISTWSGLDGALLQEVRDMRKDAPEFFYNYLKDDLQLSFLEILQLTKALKKL